MKGTNNFSPSPEEETLSDSPLQAEGWSSWEVRLTGQADLANGEQHGPARVRTD